MNDEMNSLTNEIIPRKYTHSTNFIKTINKTSFLSNTSGLTQFINSNADNSYRSKSIFLYETSDDENNNKDNISFKSCLSNQIISRELTDSLENTKQNNTDSDINLNLLNSRTKTNDTIIIHKNKITLDEVIEMKEIQNYLSMSTNYNSIVANSIRSKINYYLNNMDYRGNLKNRKNMKKISNLENENKFLNFESNKQPSKKGKSSCNIHIIHRKILSNILTSKDFFKINEKKKNWVNSSLNKTEIYEAEYQDNNKNYDDEEFNEVDEEDFISDFNTKCNVNKVKDFQEEYLKKINLKTCTINGNKNIEIIQEEKENFMKNNLSNYFVHDPKSISNSNYKPSNKAFSSKKRLFNLKRNKNFFTFNPSKVTAKLTEQKIISLIKYNLENKEINK